jgi:hypothetical protein
VTAWVLDWVRAFAGTVAVEALVALPLLARTDPRLGRRLAAVVLVNLATHPLVWFLFPGLAVRFGARLALSEAWAVIGEIAGYMIVWPGLGVGRAAITSVLANGASFAAGFLLRLAIERGG